MRSRSFILLALALGCGAVATVGISQVIERNRHQGEPLELEQIFVALTDIPPGELFTPQNTKLEGWPKGKVPAGAVVTFDELQGKRAADRIIAGEAILGARVTDRPLGVVQDIPKGYRVVAVSVNSVTAVSNLIQPGNIVDVIVHFNKNPSNGIPEATVRKVLNAVKVFSVGTMTQQQRDKDDKVIQATSVGLLVTPKQAQVLTLVSELGQIRLSLRNSDDLVISQTEEPEGIDIAELLGTSNGGPDNEGSGATLGAQSSAKSFLEMLGKGGQQAATQPAAAPVEPVPSNTRKMIVIEGDQIREVEVPAEGEIATLPGTSPASVPATTSPPASEPPAQEPSPPAAGRSS